MNQVADGLRRTPKGQLTYNREIEGKPLVDLLQKCATPPVLSSPHSELSPPYHGDGQNFSFGLSPVNGEDAGDRKTSQFALDLYKKDANTDEKGEKDAFEKENISIGDHHHYTRNGSPQWQSPQSEKNSPRGWQLDLSCETPNDIGGTKNNQSQSLKGKSSAKQNAVLSGSQSSSFDKSVNEEENMRDSIHDELTVPFTEKLYNVRRVEINWDNRVKDLIEKKQQEFLGHQTWLDSMQGQLISAVEHQQQQDMEQLQDVIEKKHHSRIAEIGMVVQKVKENHEECSRRQDARSKEVERLSQQLQEEKVRRDLALEKRLGELKALARAITETKNSLVSTLDNCPHKQYLSEVAEKTKMLVRKLSEQAETHVSNLTRDGPLEESFQRLKHFQEQSQNALDYANTLTADAEKKAKAVAEEAERQRQQQATSVQQTETVAGSGPTQVSQTPASQPAGTLQELALADVTKEFEDNIRLMMQTDAALQPFISNQQMKKLRFDLQKGVNMPVNAISPVSPAHLLEKLTRLRSLLKGETVIVQGKQVNAHSVPDGIAFCKNLVAKMIARKADEQVSSNHESAFAIAAVAVGLWVEFPDVGKLLMAHIQALCPYILPFYPPRLPNQSTENYHRSLGYKVEENGTVEAQDKFLRRMSGMMRLYAAILVTSPPQGGSHPHPHGLRHAWIWLSRCFNLQVNQEITATAIYDILQVTGHEMLMAYRVQFVKLLHYVYRTFLPKMKQAAAGSGPVSRLETFLETTMRNNAKIPLPEGYLSPGYWRC